MFKHIIFQDSRFLKAICVSGIKVDLKALGLSLFTEGSIEDRCLSIGTTMDKEFPSLTRITKERYDSLIITDIVE